MARIEWVHARLLQWAAWKASRDAKQSGFPKVNVIGRWWEPPNGREAQAFIPIDDTEAFATEQAVRGLDTRLQETVEQHYIASGSMSDDARALGCSISTVHARIEEAHRKLREAFDQRDPNRTPDKPGFYQL